MEGPRADQLQAPEAQDLTLSASAFQLIPLAHSSGLVVSRLSTPPSVLNGQQAAPELSSSNRLHGHQALGPGPSKSQASANLCLNKAALNRLNPEKLSSHTAKPRLGIAVAQEPPTRWGQQAKRVQAL